MTCAPSSFCHLANLFYFQSVLSYEWRKVGGPGAVDLEGSHTPILHVLHLVVGDYTFQLTVTDSAGQSNTASVSVVVRPEENTPPVAIAGMNKTVHYPDSEVVLDGGKSRDDYKVTNFSWTQIKWVSYICNLWWHRYRCHSQPIEDCCVKEPSRNMYLTNLYLPISFIHFPCTHYYNTVNK